MLERSRSSSRLRSFRGRRVSGPAFSSVFFFPGSDNLFADDTVFQKIDELDIELYTDKKDPDTETRIEDILERARTPLREIGSVDR
jgi:hypothetical protein